MFNEPTWIMLDYAIDDYDAAKLGKDVSEKTKLGPIAFKDLVECASQAKDIELDTRAALSTLAASL